MKSPICYAKPMINWYYQRQSNNTVPIRTRLVHGWTHDDPLTGILYQSPLVLTKRLIDLHGFTLRQHHQSPVLMKPMH